VRTTEYVAVAVWLIAVPAAAQARADCRFLCTPQLLIEPTFTVENLAKRARVATAAGEEQRQARETVFEIIFAVDIPTRLPRLGFTGEAIVVPFTRDNAVELELEANIGLIASEQTGGWVSSHFDIVDKFSPAARTGDRSAYTHKLNFEWDTGVAIFNKLSQGHWLRDVELEGSLDYVATGLPKAGDRVDGQTFVTAASPWSFSLVLVIPVTHP
jgi:hypothetical protein